MSDEGCGKESKSYVSRVMSVGGGGAPNRCHVFALLPVGVLVCHLEEGHDGEHGWSPSNCGDQRASRVSEETFTCGLTPGHEGRHTDGRFSWLGDSFTVFGRTEELQ